jgi:hypothetical protein
MNLIMLWIDFIIFISVRINSIVNIISLNRVWVTVTNFQWMVYLLLLGDEPVSAFSPSCMTRSDWNKLTFSDKAWGGGIRVVAATERFLRDLALRQWQGWLCNMQNMHVSPHLE